MVPLTPELLAASYRLLHCSAPFNGWNLPEDDDVRFKVIRHRRLWARWSRDDKGQHWIEVSSSSVGTLNTLLPFMGHEMIHLHLDELGYDRRGSVNLHSARFRALAKEACDIHHWDYCAFF